MESGMRPYQESAYVDTMNFFASGGKSALLVLPTGCGKSVLIASIAGKVAKNGGRVLLLAHRTSLVSQLANEVSSWIGEEVGVFKSSKNPGSKIVSSTVQSMANAVSHELFDHKHFALVCVDETHHIPASTYQKIVSYFDGAKLLGVTATPRRGDKTDVSKMFDKVVSEYTLSSAIRDGWLSPISVQTCNVNLDVRDVEESAGDYSVSGIGGVLAPVLRDVALEIKEKAGSRKTIVFVPLVSTAVGMVEIFRQIGMSANWVAGERKDSDEVLRAYHNGEFQVLVNSMLLTEGYNEPGISCVVNLRLTKSVSLAVQILGRGTRRCQGKDDLLVLDFLWHDKDGRHHLNAKSVVAIASGEVSEEDAADFAIACASEKDTSPRDVFEGIESARSRAKEIREARLARALAHEEEKTRSINEVVTSIKSNQDSLSYYMASSRESGLIELEKETSKYFVWKLSNKSGTYAMRVVESKDKGMASIGCRYYSPGAVIMDNYMETIEPTEAQISAIEKLGIPSSCVCDRGHTSFVLDIAYKRAAVGLCSYKQALFFSRYSFVNFDTLTKKKAAEGMDMLKKSGWKATSTLRALLGASKSGVVNMAERSCDDVEIG